MYRQLKAWGVLVMGIMGVASPIMGYETRTLVGLWPSGTTSVTNFRSYHDLGWGSNQLIVGVTTGMDKNNVLSPLALRLGVTMKTEVPLLTDFDLVVDAQRVGGGNIELASLSVIRNYTVTLAKGLELGSSVTLARLGFVGDTRFDILQAVEPVLGVKVTL